jgi:hypothetical protein
MNEATPHPIVMAGLVPAIRPLALVRRWPGQAQP